MKKSLVILFMVFLGFLTFPLHSAWSETIPEDVSPYITNQNGMSGNHWSAQIRQLHVGDFNGDGSSDILLQGQNGHDTFLLIAEGNSGFNNAQNITKSIWDNQLMIEFVNWLSPHPW